MMVGGHRGKIVLPAKLKDNYEYFHGNVYKYEKYTTEENPPKIGKSVDIR